jgi:cold shock CspA family protein
VVRGTVASFDEARGAGEIAGADGVTYPFHSTVIADGSRTIADGAEVEFDVVPGHLGRWEAAAVRPADASGG